MLNTLVFTKIKKEDIFSETLETFDKNNEIIFSNDGIAVIYGPNGTGKTSLAKVLNRDESSSFEVQFEDLEFTEQNSNLFHVINDQNSRNLIEGDTEEFLLGDDIKKEYDLQRYLESEYNKIFTISLADRLKKEFNIAKKSSELIKRVTNPNIKRYIEDLANNKSKGLGICRDEFLNCITSLNIQDVPEYDDKNFTFLKMDYESKNSILMKVMQLSNLHKNENVRAVEEHDEAIRVLNKFSYMNECIVCDNTEIDTHILISRKEANKGKIYEELDDETKRILEEIIQTLKGDDPFCIESILLNAIKMGDKTPLETLKEEIEYYFLIFNIELNNLFASCLEDSNIIDKSAEYKLLLMTKPELSDEDILFIERMVNENIEKNIALKRDENDNLKLLLGDKEFLNQDRNNLHLSNGEQNFISLSFELLKAKNSDKKIIVLDDPISSFDSIFKNKITFAIIKFLEGKRQIILTHNTELIKLLEHQKQNCFNLYLFNNTLNEENGFITVNKKEQEILLYLDKLLDLFRSEIFKEIENEKYFLISMIPFMRGYAQITSQKSEKDKLTMLMHGYQDERVNITDIYNELFGTHEKITNSYEVSAQDIIGLQLENIGILKAESQYPLLNKTLKHTLVYLYLRLNVENTLVNTFSINTKTFDILGKIIFKSFSNNTPEDKENRIFLASKKTLLNEFNHFEGNMNIFQPAIDISDTALKKESESIINFLSELNILASSN
ncbi:AAA family ATPase [Sporosarcina ureae]|uniref:AAA family ATPase n=1 Tax=Sporosarcina ureae TaxID=1571 RepID=UPI0018DD0717|nr:AAA family ATPase [Sporosarcina ureae]